MKPKTAPGHGPQVQEPTGESKANQTELLARAMGEGPKLPPQIPNLDDLAEQAFREGFAATELKWNAATKGWDKYPAVWARLETLKAYLTHRYGLPEPLRANVERAVPYRHKDLVQLAQTETGRKLLLEAGAVDKRWLAKYSPAA